MSASFECRHTLRQAGEGRKIMQYSKPPEMVIDTTKEYSATIETNKGDLVIVLFAGDVPKTVNSFVFLAREGYGIPAPKTAEDRKLADIASTARLELILRQNVAMAHAIGQRSVSEHPDILERWPNYRYVANTERHARFDGLVLPKKDPFWRTHYPPWEFRCGCMALDEDAEANAKSSGMRDQGQRGRVRFRGRPGETGIP